MHEVQKVLNAASLRLMVVEVLRTGTVLLSVSLAALFLIKVVEKLTPIDFPWAQLFIGAAAFTVVGALVWAYARRARGVDLARVVDERAGLRESLSTALCVARADDPWSKAVVETARDRARRVVVRDAVPIQAPRLWQVPIVAALALASMWFVGRHDLTGYLAKKEQEEAIRDEIRQVMSEVQVDQEKLDELLRKAGIEDGTGDEAPQAEPQRPEPRSVDEIRREALRNLTKMSEQIQAKQDGEQARTLAAIERNLEQLKAPGPGPMTEFARSLARGNYADAQAKLDEMAEKLATGQMNEAEKEAAQEQLANLKEQLDQLAQNTDKIEQALRQAGMTAEQASKLAQAASDPQAMKDALEQLQNLSEQQKQQLMDMAQAQCEAGEACQGMAGAIGQMAQAMSESNSSGAMSEAMDSMSQQLSQMEMAQQEMQNLQNAMAECNSQMQKLGECMSDGSSGQCFGDGAGTQGQWAAGDSSLSQGSGSGGPGQGQGGSMDEERTDFMLQREKVQVANQGGPIIGETIIYGAQVRGESKASFQETVAQARAQSSEAIESKAVPKQYETAIQHYFGRLEAVARTQRAQPAETKEPESK
ncbi:MAG: hypothetical protein KIT88_01535 [Phycisphaeraceae bacterium]|nr:hypothetical protein [Phycisphaeraceae bacterium]